MTGEKVSGGFPVTVAIAFQVHHSVELENCAAVLNRDFKFHKNSISVNHAFPKNTTPLIFSVVVLHLTHIF